MPTALPAFCGSTDWPANGRSTTRAHSKVQLETVTSASGLRRTCQLPWALCPYPAQFLTSFNHRGDRKHQCGSWRHRRSSFLANGRRSPTKLWKAGVRAADTIRGSPHAPRQDARRDQNGQLLPRVLRVTASTGCDRCRQTARLLPLLPRPILAHRRHIKPHDAPAWEGPQSERKTRPRRRLLGQTSTALRVVRVFGLQPYTLPRNASLRFGSA